MLFRSMAFGFDTIEVDGHDLTQLRQTLANAGLAAGRPKAVICHTVKGKGIPLAENDFNWHWKGGIDGALVAKKIQVATAICASTV